MAYYSYGTLEYWTQEKKKAELKVDLINEAVRERLKKTTGFKNEEIEPLLEVVQSANRDLADAVQKYEEAVKKAEAEESA